ncbi:transposase (fragment) [Vibrio coralliirubri]
MSGDGAYNTRACTLLLRLRELLRLPPPPHTREGAAFWELGHPRDLAVGCQKLYCSNKYWKEWYGYHKHSLSETAMY